jgi:hypothetical protein
VRGLVGSAIIDRKDVLSAWTLGTFFLQRNAFSVPASSVRHLSRQWINRLVAYRRHRNDEHLEALLEEALRYTGLHLENDLSRSSFWAKAPLARRVAVLLFLVDRGVVERRTLKGRRVYEPREGAESWVAAQPSLEPYTGPTLELIAALRRDMSSRSRTPRF